MFREHLDAVGDLVRVQLGGRSLLEVGCGKGTFLEHLQSRGFEVQGVDPAYEGTNPAVVKAMFTPELDFTPARVILRHVLEHVQDPVGFLGQIRDANGGTGAIYIEVPCFDWICAHRAWFDVFYEHVNYFRLADLARDVRHRARLGAALRQSVHLRRRRPRDPSITTPDRPTTSRRCRRGFSTRSSRSRASSSMRPTRCPSGAPPRRA